MVQGERSASDVCAFEPCAPHAGAHTFDDQVAFEFRHRVDDARDGSGTIFVLTWGRLV